LSDVGKVVEDGDEGTEGGCLAVGSGSLMRRVHLLGQFLLGLPDEAPRYISSQTRMESARIEKELGIEESTPMVWLIATRSRTRGLEG
jgi:hypothetical protein